MAKTVPFKAPAGHTTLKFLKELADVLGLPIHTISMPSLMDGNQLRCRFTDVIESYPKGTRGMFVLDNYDRAIGHVQEAAADFIRGDDPSVGNWCVVQLVYPSPEFKSAQAG